MRWIYFQDLNSWKKSQHIYPNSVTTLPLKINFGNGNLNTTNQRAEIAFNWLSKVPFVNPPKDAKNSAISAVKFVNQYSGLEKKLQFHLNLRTCCSQILYWAHTAAKWDWKVTCCEGNVWKALFTSPEYSQNIPKMQLKLIHICNISPDTLSRRLAEYVCIWEILRFFRGIKLVVWVKQYNTRYSCRG